MQREDKFVGLVGDGADGDGFADFGSGPVAEFKYAMPVFVCYRHFSWGSNTHFRLNLSSLLIRIENLKLPINYGKVPWTLQEEYTALQEILNVHN